jgi:putative glutamine amidotransferase
VTVPRPLIGITTYVVPASWSYWNLEAALIPTEYVRAVEQTGGRPVLLPPTPDGTIETLDALHGLLLTGGEDLDPQLYGEEQHAATFGINARRDRAELALVRGALERDMPLLGICRGCQLLNVARGGALVQHIPDVVGSDRHKESAGTFAAHGVELLAGSRLATLLGEHAPVHSHHHQGLGRVGEGLVPAARADDGTLEAVEDPSRRFAVGILWHAEMGEDTRLFTALVQAAAAYRNPRR